MFVYDVTEISQAMFHKSIFCCRDRKPESKDTGTFASVIHRPDAITFTVDKSWLVSAPSCDITFLQTKNTISLKIKLDDKPKTREFAKQQ